MGYLIFSMVLCVVPVGDILFELHRTQKQSLQEQEYEVELLRREMTCLSLTLVRCR